MRERNVLIEIIDGCFFYPKSETGAAEIRTAAKQKTKGNRNVQNEMAKTELSS